MDDDNVKLPKQPDPKSAGWIHENESADTDDTPQVEASPVGFDNSSITDRVVLRAPLPDSAQTVEPAMSQTQDFVELARNEQDAMEDELFHEQGNEPDQPQQADALPDEEQLPQPDDDQPGETKDDAPLSDEITGQAEIAEETPQPEPPMKEKTAPIAIIPPMTDTAVVADPTDWEVERLDTQKEKRFLGMSPLQRFIFFLFLLIVLVILGTLFLALSGKISLPFLMQLIT